MCIRTDIKKFVAMKWREAKVPETRKKMMRLAELNCAHRMIPPHTLTPTEEVEREFLMKTLPHVTYISGIKNLLKKLPKKGVL